MSLLLLRIMLGMGIVGHALNMYCDRILSIFPNGTINFSNIKEITEGDNAAKLMEGVSEKIPMRSAVLGGFCDSVGVFRIQRAWYLYVWIFQNIWFYYACGDGFFLYHSCSISCENCIGRICIPESRPECRRKKDDAGFVKYCAGFTGVRGGVSVSPCGICHCCRHRCDWIPHLGIDFYDPSHCHCNVPVSNHRNASHWSYGIHAGVDVVIVG